MTLNHSPFKLRKPVGPRDWTLECARHPGDLRLCPLCHEGRWCERCEPARVSCRQRYCETDRLKAQESGPPLKATRRGTAYSPFIKRPSGKGNKPYPRHQNTPTRIREQWVESQAKDLRDRAVRAKKTRRKSKLRQRRGKIRGR